MKNTELLQYEAICQYYGIEIEKPKSIKVYGEKINIQNFPKLNKLNNLSALTHYSKKGK